MQKRLLKDILRQRRIAGEPGEEPIKLLLVSPHKRGEGFRSINRVTYNEINVEKLSLFRAGSEVTPEILAEKMMLHKNSNPVVILGDGEINKALTVKAHRFSKTARKKIEAAGGKVELIGKE